VGKDFRAIRRKAHDLDSRLPPRLRRVCRRAPFRALIWPLAVCKSVIKTKAEKEEKEASEKRVENKVEREDNWGKESEEEEGKAAEGE